MHAALEAKLAEGRQQLQARRERRRREEAERALRERPRAAREWGALWEAALAECEREFGPESGVRPSPACPPGWTGLGVGSHAFLLELDGLCDLAFVMVRDARGWRRGDFGRGGESRWAVVFDAERFATFPEDPQDVYDPQYDPWLYAGSLAEALALAEEEGGDWARRVWDERRVERLACQLCGG